jgi:predicted TPR repeat methyltransferase
MPIDPGVQSAEAAIGALYDQMAPAYLQRQRPVDRAYLEQCEFRELFALAPSHRQVLDLGCGIGRVGIALSQRNIEYTGVDISEGILRAASSLSKSAPFLVRASAIALPFADQQFTFVTCFGLYEYVEDLSLHLQEATRVMRRGTDFIFTVHTLAGARRYNRYGGYRRTGWSESNLSSLLTAAGFIVRSFRPAIGPLRRVRSLISHVAPAPQIQAAAGRWLAALDLAVCAVSPHCANEFVVTCRYEG